MAIDPETYRTAGFLVERYGGQAVSIAADRTKEALDRDDVAESAVWAMITEATEELLRTDLAEDEPIH